MPHSQENQSIVPRLYHRCTFASLTSGWKFYLYLYQSLKPFQNVNILNSPVFKQKCILLLFSLLPPPQSSRQLKEKMLVLGVTSDCEKGKRELKSVMISHDPCEGCCHHQYRTYILKSWVFIIDLTPQC